jgi:hypothetical protein
MEIVGIQEKKSNGLVRPTWILDDKPPIQQSRNETSEPAAQKADLFQYLLGKAGAPGPSILSWD